MLTFHDPDGLVIDLVASPGDARSGWDGVARVPTEHAVRGLYSVTMSERLLDPTAQMLAGMLGMHLGGEDAGRARFAMASGGPGTVVDVAAGDEPRGLQAGGTVHHIAFRAPDGQTQARVAFHVPYVGYVVSALAIRQARMLFIGLPALLIAVVVVSRCPLIAMPSATSPTEVPVACALTWSMSVGDSPAS